MDRRNFVKLVGTASGTVISTACGPSAEEVIPLLVSEEEILPGVEQRHPTVCPECSAGCGMIARVMASERVIEVDGAKARQRIAAIKMLEGNPEDIVSGGAICARGHSALQGLYNPDRLRQPMRRVGPRGSDEFELISWDEALEQASTALQAALTDGPEGILYLGRSLDTLRAANVARFLESLGAPPAESVGAGDFAPEKRAAERLFGWEGVPVYEIQDATMVLSIGADFLGGWTSPVLYSRRYGHMRQGRRELRGRLVHVESRFSLTAWNANRWVPVAPGGELAFALALGHVLVAEDMAAAAEVPDSILQMFSEVSLDAMAEAAGVPADTLQDLAVDLTEASAPVVIAGASMVRENSTDAVLVGNALNFLLGSVGQPGGVLPPAADPLGLVVGGGASASGLSRLAEARLVFLGGEDPAHVAPWSRDALAAAESVISFSSFLDDSSMFADLILPDHDPLERSGLSVPTVSPAPSVAAAEAFVKPLHDTRATEEVLAVLAEAVGAAYGALSLSEALALLPDGESSSSVREVLRRGTWQGRRDPDESTGTAPTVEPPATARAEALLFQVYPSLQFAYGQAANRPWMQELPDPTSSAMWGMPVELDPGTAAQLGVQNGDRVLVKSEHGSIEAPVYVHPAAIPGVVSMALGQGHVGYGRYASGRGSNPMSVVGEMHDAATGTLALGPTPVEVVKLDGSGGLIQFSRQDRDETPYRI